ncbi:MAG: DNA cytosine methyltransferase [Lentisphaerae bacterium]|nr:DNA cytosine methyltransferase [Lentisphaerota bacterium]
MKSTPKPKKCDLSPESFAVHEANDSYLDDTADKASVFSFFSGAGFLDLGFEMSGKFAIRFANEIQISFLQTYRYSRRNLGLPEPTFGYSPSDIAWLLEHEEMFTFVKSIIEKTKAFSRPVGFIGGPPCPDFSVGGKNRGREGENGKLSGTYVELICQMKPDFFLFENVKGLYRTVKHRAFFDELKEKLNNAGYVMTERLVNALSYGAPQDRERILLVGFHADSDRLGFDPAATIANFPWNRFARKDASLLKNLNWPGMEPFHESVMTLPPEGIPLELTVQHWFERNHVDEHPNAKHCFIPREGLKKFLAIPEGDDKKKSYKRLHRWRYSPTAAYGNNEVHLHPYHARRISVAEALAIQSLPRNFLIPPSIPLSDMFKTVGNGVPFILSSAIAKTIALFIETKGKCL